MQTPNGYIHHDTQYLDLLRKILDMGNVKGDRTGTGTLSTFGARMEFDLSNGRIPLLTTKKVNLRAIIHELIWFISGSTDVKYLKDNNVGIWDAWVKEHTAEWRYFTAEEIIAKLEKQFGKPVKTKAIRFGQGEALIPVDKGDHVEIPYLDFTNGDFEEGLDVIWINAYVTATGKIARELVAGDLGPIYGKQWREWETNDQRPMTEEEIIQTWVKRIKDNDPLAQVPAFIKSMDGESTDTVIYYGDRYSLERQYQLHFNDDQPPTAPLTIDQLQDVIDQLKNNPNSRRIIVSAWNPSQIHEMGLPPCHTLYQFYTRELGTFERAAQWIELSEGQSQVTHIQLLESLGIFVNVGPNDEIHLDTTGLDAMDDYVESIEKLEGWMDKFNVPKRALSCQLYQRSADMPLGVPFNIAQYSILVHMVAQVVNMVPEKFVWVGGDVHIYDNQIDGVCEQLTREPVELHPRVELNKAVTSLFDFTFEDIAVVDYEPLPAIKFPAAAV